VVGNSDFGMPALLLAFDRLVDSHSRLSNEHVRDRAVVQVQRIPFPLH